jgi:hypothetical protein
MRAAVQTHAARQRSLLASGLIVLDSRLESRDHAAVHSRSLFRIALGIAALATLISVAPGCASKSANGTAAPRSKKRSPAELAELLATATATGRELHRRDMIAWWASDVAVPQLGPEDLEHMRGWLLDADDPNTVHFLIEIDGQLFTRLRVRCDGTGPDGCTSELLAEPAPISERNSAQQRALASAGSHPEFVPTSDRYNHVVIPTADSGWSVYLIAATVDPNLMMFGRHYRFSISPDGNRVTDWRAFTESALVLEHAELPPDAALAAVAVSHLLDDTPTEMHVWAALNYHTPLAVVTDRDVIWMIDETGAIALVE